MVTPGAPPPRQPAPPGSSAAGPLLVGLGGWLVLAPYFLQPSSVDSADDQKLLEYGAAVVLVLAGVRLWTGRTSSRAAVVAAAVGSAALLVSALVAPQGLVVLVVNDVVCAILAAVLAGLAWTGRNRA